MVALRKVKVLLQFGVYITVVAPVICRELKELERAEGKLVLIEREFMETDIAQSFFVVAATSNAVVNRTVSALCKQADTLVNVADSKENSSYLFPSILKRGDMIVGTSTSGNSPDAAKWIRTALETAIPDYAADLAESLGEYRNVVKERIVSEEARKKAFQELLNTGIKAEGKVDANMVEKVIQKYQHKS